MSKNTILRTIPHYNSTDATTLIVQRAKNVTIQGGTIEGDRYTRTAITAPYNSACLRISGSKNVVVRDTALIDSAGDCLFLATYPWVTTEFSGSGYTSPPTVSLNGGGGSGAVITAVLGDGAKRGDIGTVYRFNTVNAGTGWTSEPTVTLNGGGGTGAVAEAAIAINPDTSISLNGVRIKGAYRLEDILIDNVRMSNATRNSCTSLYSEDVVFSHCEFSSANGFSPEAGVDVEPDGQSPRARNLLFTGCLFKDNNQAGFVSGHGVGSEGITIVDSVFNNNNLAINMINSTRSTVSRNSVVPNPTAGLGAGIGFQRCTNAVITENTLIFDTTVSGQGGITFLNPGVDDSHTIIANNNVFGVNRGINIGSGSDTSPTSGVSICGNTVSGSVLCIRLNANATNLLIDGNRMDGQISLGLKTLSNSVISNNVHDVGTQDAGIRGILNNVDITGNVISNWGDKAVNLNDSGNVRIMNNIFKHTINSRQVFTETRTTAPNSFLYNDCTYIAATRNPIAVVDLSSLYHTNIHPKVSSPPSTGAFYVGQNYVNATPTAGGYMGWVCVATGSPGVWKGYGSIQM